MSVYIAARSLAGFASGALAAVGMGVLAQELSGRARRFTLAANTLTWVASSLAGPAYAAYVAAAFTWRVALVAYLPLLVVARLVIIRELAHNRPQTSHKAEPTGWGWAVTLAAGMLLLGSATPVTLRGAALTVIGLALVAVGVWNLMPPSVLSPRSTGGAAAIRVIGWAAALQFGANTIVTIVGHDRLGMGPHQLGLLLTAGGLAWALVGLALARRPATRTRFAWQGLFAFLVMGVGAAMMACGTWGSDSTVFFAGWVVMNLGMGLIYLDAMNLAFDDSLPEALGAVVAGATVAFIEPLTGGVTGTLAAALVSAGVQHGWIAFAVLAVLALPAAHAARRVASR